MVYTVTWWTGPGIPWVVQAKVCPTQLMDPHKLLFHMNGWSWLMLHNFLNPIKQATAGFSEPQVWH